MKKLWSTPQLVVLARLAPQEAVLLTCKTTASGTAPHNIAVGCQQPGSTSPCGPTIPGANLNAFNVCVACSTLGES